MKKQMIIEAYQVPKGNVSPDIFKLPCVECVNKKYDRTIEYGVFVTWNKVFDMVYANSTDWICKDAEGRWWVFTDEEYNVLKSY